jgi:type IV pilus biogenesis protein PilP
MKMLAATALTALLMIGLLSITVNSRVVGQEAMPLPTPPSEAPAPVSEDAVTNERVEVLDQSGLIARQSEISEGMFLMDLQLRQAEMIARLLSVLGPDAEIEVAPGEFRRFSDTPAAIRERIALLELQARLSERLQELDENSSPINPFPVAVVETPLPSQVTTVDPFTAPSPAASATVVEIYGEVGAFRAILDLSGETLEVRANDVLPSGEVVANVRRDAVGIIDRFGELRTLEIRR